MTVPWDPAYGTLLELAEACDVPAQWSCRTGVCHACETALLKGQVAYSPPRRSSRRRSRRPVRQGR
ncbi:2Fe-2S iron-sulfur cluster-binding protein [Streptomyces sp. LUP47B]|uniref:2Fe-2S iron-sulfur cluster-binding protein n=1 Tax=Streptomyces sp. LUP47B TaxID=1890286 RepID=UPI0009A063A7